MSDEYDPTGNALKRLRELYDRTATHFGLVLYNELNKVYSLDTQKLNEHLGDLHNRRASAVIDSKFTILLTEFVKEFNTLGAVSDVLNTAHSEAMEGLVYQKTSLPRVSLFLSSNIFGDDILEFQVK